MPQTNSEATTAEHPATWWRVADKNIVPAGSHVEEQTHVEAIDLIATATQGGEAGVGRARHRRSGELDHTRRSGHGNGACTHMAWIVAMGTARHVRRREQENIRDINMYAAQ